MFATTILGVTISAIWAVLLLTLWIIIAFWPATIAKSKGYSFLLWFLISIFFWWIALFVVLFLKDKNELPPTATPPTEN
jgi:hypothetical protein